MSKKYIDLYKKYHHEHAGYGSGGGLKFYLNHIVDLVHDTKSETLLDYGCGKADGYFKYNHHKHQLHFLYQISFVFVQKSLTLNRKYQFQKL